MNERPRSSIIIVDNDKVLLNMIKAGLSSAGYRCETTTSSGTALELIGESPFDILVTDIVMPGMDGFELAEKAKRLRPEMTVIIMTGFIDDFSYDRALEAGACDFIKKPFTMKERKMKLEQVTLQEKLREMSISDEITGLCNRKGFLIMAEQQLKLATRYGNGIFGLYAVLDNLKAISDAFGVREANQSLADAADILRKTFREADIVARTGKDEFMVMPVGFEGDDMGAVADDLEANIAKYNAARRPDHKLSIRFGTAYYDPENPCPLEEFLVAARKRVTGQGNI